MFKKAWKYSIIVRFINVKERNSHLCKDKTDLDSNSTPFCNVADTVKLLEYFANA